jgi:hypothetical protein
MRRSVQRVAFAALLWGGPALAGDLRPGDGAAPAVEATARGAFEALRREQPAARATYRPGREAPAMVTGLAVPTTGAPADAALDFLRRHAGLLGVPPADLRLAGSETAAGRTVVRFEQWHGGVRVHDAVVVVTFDDAHRILRVVNDAAPVADVSPATIDAAAARTLAVHAVLGPAVHDAPATVTPVILAAGGRSVAGFEVDVAQVPLLAVRAVLVDGHDGRVIGVTDRVVK